MRFVSYVPRLLVAAALLLTPTMACNPKTIRVQLPAFGSGDVDGIWLWRLESSGYQRACRFDLSNPYLSGGREVVDYRQICADGRSSAAWQATVERLPSNPATVTLALLFQPVGALAPHRATSFNAAGESVLSSSMLSL